MFLPSPVHNLNAVSIVVRCPVANEGDASFPNVVGSRQCVSVNLPRAVSALLIRNVLDARAACVISLDGCEFAVTFGFLVSMAICLQPGCIGASGRRSFPLVQGVFKRAGPANHYSLWR